MAEIIHVSTINLSGGDDKKLFSYDLCYHHGFSANFAT